MTATSGARSDDGWWVWNGYEWRPSYGFPPPPQLVKSRHVMIDPKAWSPLLLALTAGWLILIGVWAPILILVAHRIGPNGTMSRVQGGAILAALALAGAATLVFGIHLGWVRKPWQILTGQILAESMLGTTVLVAWYVIAMAASSDPAADDAAAVGVIILTIPTLVLVLLVLVVGAGAGAVARLTTLRRNGRT